MPNPVARTLTCLALVVHASIACAEQPAGWMSDDQIKAAFSGVTIDGIYTDGTTFTESYAGDGAISYADPRKQMVGRWSVLNRSFCTLYDGAVTGGCFRVARHSANCYEFHFFAATESETVGDDQDRPRLTARGWNRAEPPTCNEKPAV